MWTDSEGAIGKHEITIVIAPDQIRPEIYMEPDVGFSPVEDSDMKLTYNGFDNVKVEQLEVYRSYSVRQSDESVSSSDWQFMESQKLHTIN